MSLNIFFKKKKKFIIDIFKKPKLKKNFLINDIKPLHYSKKK